MAATAVNSMAHQLPAMHIPPMPRIRPPRLLKGQTNPNNAPQPPEIPDTNSHWIQGRWRNRVSSAYKNKSKSQALRVSKALRHQTHGLDIYAYRHIRTNQVVYSLSRTLRENKVLNQLLYHGKKTVPAAVRSDMWTPYYSIHFPPTPAGALEGLFAFQKLRELSIQRQLSPPEDLTRVTQEDINVIKSKLGSPTTLQEMAVQNKLKGKIPKVDEILPKKLRARKLMDQKATSVADAAFVLDWILSGPSPWERVTRVAMNRVIHASEMSERAAQRTAKVRKTIEERAAEIRKRASLAVRSLESSDRTSVNLTLKTLRRLSREHHVPHSKEEQILDMGTNDQPEIDLANLDPATYIPPTVAEKLMRRRERIEAGQEWTTTIIETKAREQVAKTAEQQAIKEWFENNEAPNTDSGSLWDSVSVARQNALEAFDQRAQAERQGREDRAAKEEQEREAQVETESHISPRMASNAARSRETDEPTLETKLEALKPDWATDPREVKMYWADLNDGRFASTWPTSVLHGSLAPYAVSKELLWAPVRDEEGNDVPDGTLVKIAHVDSKSVHVMGGAVEDGWMPPEYLTGSKQPPVWLDPPDSSEVEEGQAPMIEDSLQVDYQDLESPISTKAERGGRIETGDEDIVVEQPKKGLWGRVTGLFRR